MIIKHVDQSVYKKFINLFDIDVQLFINKLRLFKWEKTYFPKFFCREKHIPLFTSIEIETINRCNETCSFCPANKHVDRREFKLMDEELFLSIIAQLKKVSYKGKICLHSNNEPFLDDRMVHFIKIVSESLPNAFHYLYTNGTLLTLHKFTEVIDYLDELIIDNYNDKLTLNKTTKEIHEYCKAIPLLNKKVKIAFRTHHEILSSRGGNAPNKQDTRLINLSCLLPFRQMVVRPDGKLSLCCNDVWGQCTLGDLTKQRLVDVWNSEQYRNVREKLASKKNRQNINICSKCDAILFI